MLPDADELFRQAERHRLAGDSDKARGAYGAALAIYERAGDRLGEADVLTGLGNLEGKLGNDDGARAAIGRGARPHYVRAHAPAPPRPRR